MLISKPLIDQLSGLPGVQGIVHTDDAEGTSTHTGTEAEALGDILTYFRQVCSLIGDSFGLEELEEAQLSSKAISALCIPLEGQTLGVILHPKAKTSEVASLLRTQLQAL